MGEGLDDPTSAIRLPHHLGSLALDQGDLVTARAQFLASLRTLCEHNSWFWAHTALADFANLAAAEGQSASALRLAGALERLYETTGAMLQPSERRHLERSLMAARKSLPEEAQSAARAEGRALTLEEMIAYALEKADGGKRPTT